MSTNLYDAVRIAIEHRLGEDQRSADILGNIPAYVRRAVNKLQQTNIIEPTQVEYTNADFQPFFDVNGNEQYSYISLPDNFVELHRLYVNGVEPTWHISAISIDKHATDNPGVVYYNVGSASIGGSITRYLAMGGLPNDAVITLRYHGSVDNALVESLGEKYWEAIIKQVESYLDLPTTQAAIINEQRAKSEAEELASGWRNQSQLIFRTNGRFFGGGRRNGRLVR